MPKFTGVLMFDVTIEEQDSQAKVDAIESKVKHAIEAITGVESASLVDSDIDEQEDEPEEDEDE